MNASHKIAVVMKAVMGDSFMADPSDRFVRYNNYRRSPRSLNTSHSRTNVFSQHCCGDEGGIAAMHL